MLLSQRSACLVNSEALRPVAQSTGVLHIIGYSGASSFVEFESMHSWPSGLPVKCSDYPLQGVLCSRPFTHVDGSLPLLLEWVPLCVQSKKHFDPFL